MRRRWRTAEDIARWHCMMHYGELITVYRELTRREDKLRKFNLRYSSMMVLKKNPITMVNVTIYPVGYILVNLRKQKVVKATPRWRVIEKVDKYQKQFLKRVKKWWGM